jgi:hypothetical protein
MSTRKHSISTKFLQNSEKNIRTDKLNLMQEMRYTVFHLRKFFIIVSEVSDGQICLTSISGSALHYLRL